MEKPIGIEGWDIGAATCRHYDGCERLDPLSVNGDLFLCPGCHRDVLIVNADHKVTPFLPNNGAVWVELAPSVSHFFLSMPRLLPTALLPFGRRHRFVLSNDCAPLNGISFFPESCLRTADCHFSLLIPQSLLPNGCQSFRFPTTNRQTPPVFMIVKKSVFPDGGDYFAWYMDCFKTAEDIRMCRLSISMWQLTMPPQNSRSRS